MKLRTSGTKILIDIFIIAIVSITAFFIYTQYGNHIQEFFLGEESIHVVYVGNVPVMVTNLDTENERKHGLSGVVSLPENAGKLLTFDDERRHAIWMKDMYFPLDILWFNNNLEMVHMETYVDPDTYPAKFIPNERARFVLEVNAGFVDQFQVALGDIITLPAIIIPVDLIK